MMKLREVHEAENAKVPNPPLSELVAGARLVTFSLYSN
jgi:hypothetical protein